MDFFWLSFFKKLRLDLQFFRQVDDELEVVEGIFIDSAYAVVNEERAQQKGQEENLCVVIFVFVQRAYPFAVH